MRKMPNDQRGFGAKSCSWRGSFADDNGSRAAGTAFSNRNDFAANHSEILARQHLGLDKTIQTSVEFGHEIDACG
jgi:hypothetical protein